MSLSVIDRNDVVLRGRLSAPPQLRALPSGDRLLLFKLVVREQARPRGPKSGVITCVSYLPAVQRYAVGWTSEDVVEVEGTLQRRFWRTPTGTAVAYEVNCRRGRKVARAADRPDARAASPS